MFLHTVCLQLSPYQQFSPAHGYIQEIIWCSKTFYVMSAVFIMRPSYRLRTRLARPSVRLSLRPSVRPSVCAVRVRNSKTKKRRKIKIGINVPHGTCKWSANFQFERSKVEVTGRKNLKHLASCLLADGSAGDTG